MSKSREFQIFLQVPFWVKYEGYPPEGDGRLEPRIGSAVQVEDIEICDDLKEWLEKEYADDIETAALEDWLENK